MAMSDNTKDIFRVLQEDNGDGLTAPQIADKLGSTAKSVTASVNALVKKGFAERREGSITDDEGKEKAIKFIYITDEGAAVDIDSLD